MNKKEIIKKSLLWIEQGREIALATVIATWGSSPRPVGSQMVVDGHGNFEGSVSGGCIEAEVIAEALEVIEEGVPRILSFGVTNDQAWESGLACGGKVDVWVAKATDQVEILKKLNNLLETRNTVCLVADLETGEKTFVQPHSSETLLNLSFDMGNAAKDLFATEGSIVLESDGRRFFLHCFVPEQRLVIVGAVHISMALAQIARIAGYEVEIIDPRKAFASVERFPDVKLRDQWPDDALKEINVCPKTAVVVLTHDPKIDDPALIEALGSKAFYIGALGSRKTHADRLARLAINGLPEESLQRIHAPVGLSIGAKSPQEIAISIMAEIVQKWYLI
ncbi:MAG: XdhC family protein [Deltaproteobacteria bacterium]|nr:XdhC family protein [Deltaproteobacteria bacterium]